MISTQTPPALRVSFLDHGWTVRSTGGPVPADVAAALPIPATVPGVIHTDLLAAGLIPDPYLDRNELLLAWIGQCDWTWSTRWTVDEAMRGAERCDLVFDGIDTVARVIVDGVEVLATADQHRSHRIDVTEIVRSTGSCSHLLEVAIESPIRYVDRMSMELGSRPHVNDHPYPAIRKMASNFGWDWGPDLVTSGIWRPVRIESWSDARLAEIRPVARVDRIAEDGMTCDGVVSVEVFVERAPGGQEQALEATVSTAAGSATAVVPSGVDRVHVEVPVSDTPLWWPVGHGPQPLHDVEIGLSAAGRVLDARNVRLGFRTVDLDTSIDDRGHRFSLSVNGRSMFVRGVNWIPDDAFPHRVTTDRYRARLGQARDVGANLVRVWGGGIYEADIFYDICDEFGLLTWQDFLFACAAYAEEQPLWGEIEAEVRENVTRLAPHPSLVVWSGSNENYVGHQQWGWPGRLEGRTWGRKYYEELLPRVLEELDGTRPYIPSSPWSGDSAVPVNDPDNGSMHLWETWNRLGWDSYRDTVPRFAAEWGWQAPPRESTLHRALHDDPLTPESPSMITHQKAISGNDKLTDGLTAHLPLPNDMSDWVWAMALNQAWAVTTGVTHHRSWWPATTGTVYWQLNDMWPVTSWSVVDGDGRLKPAYYALRHAFADRLCTVQPRGEDLVVVLVNDTDALWEGEVALRRATFSGRTLHEETVVVSVPPRKTRTVRLGEGFYAERPEEEFVVAALGGSRDIWYYAEARDAELPAPDVEMSVARVEEGFALTVRAHSFVRDLTILPDRLDPAAVVEDTMWTLLPGEERMCRILTSVPMTAEDLAAPDVARSANQLVAGR